MFCKICGLNIDDHLKSCPNCGSAVVNAPSEQQPTSQIPPVIMMSAPATANTNDKIAIASLVLGIVAASSNIICCVPVGIICAIVGLILGLFALKSKKRTQAIVGISLSAVAIVISVIVIIFWAFVIANSEHTDFGMPTEDYSQYEYSRFDKN